MSDFIIRPGDTVVCLDAGLPAQPTALHTMVENNLSVGARYTVLATVWLYGEKGLHLAQMDHRPTDGWRSSRFRKVLDDEEKVYSHGGLTAPRMPADAHASLGLIADSGLDISEVCS